MRLFHINYSNAIYTFYHELFTVLHYNRTSDFVKKFILCFAPMLNYFQNHFIEVI